MRTGGIIYGFLPSFIVLENVFNRKDSHEEIRVPSGLPSIPWIPSGMSTTFATRGRPRFTVVLSKCSAVGSM